MPPRALLSTISLKNSATDENRTFFVVLIQKNL